MQSAVGCITHSRFVGRLPHLPQLNRTYTLPLNDGDPVSLRSSPGVVFSAGQKFRIIDDNPVERGQYRATTIQYWYQFATMDGSKLFTWHWTPETRDPGQRRFPHLHIGSGLVDPNGPFLPDTLSGRHIPTGRVSIEAIVRFAIEELGAEPVRQDWDGVLTEGHASFIRNRRPER